MKKIIISLGLLTIFLISVGSVEARSGCCSHHLGVRADGCGCNDGTPLSSTCAPYYVCQYSNTNTAAVTNTPTSVPATATPYPTATLTPTRKPTPTKILVKKNVEKRINKPKPTVTPKIQKHWWDFLFGK